MKYRVQLDLAFEKESDMKKIVDTVKLVSAKAVTLNTGEVNEEKPIAQWHKCYHDEGKACEPIQKILQEIR